MKNITNALAILTTTILLAAAITALLDWSWVAAHWQRQVIVTTLMFVILILGLYLAFVNLTAPAAGDND